MPETLSPVFARGQRRSNRQSPSVKPAVEALESRALPSAAPLLHVSADQHHLLDPNNKPYYLIGDSGWFTEVKLTDAQANQYFQTRSSQGFNTILIDAVSASFQGGYPFGPTDAAGDAPFTAYLPGTQSWDVSKPNSVYWQHIDNMLNAASQNGIEVLFNAYDNYNGFLAENSAANLKAFGQFLGQRYRNQDNIIWMFGNDYGENPTEDAKILAEVQGIRQYDSRHETTLELWYTGAHPQNSFDDPVLRSSMTLNGLYTYNSMWNRGYYLDQYNRSDAGPTLNIESDYDRASNPDEATLRDHHYAFFLSGAAGDMYGNGDVWPMVSGWEQQLSSPGAIQVSYFAKLLQSIDWGKLVPDQNGTVFQDVGDPDRCAAYAPDGSLAVAYRSPNGTNALSFAMNMSAMSGPVTARWYNPTNGTFTPIDTNLANSGTHTFITPGDNGTGTNDWVLILQTGASGQTQAPTVATAATASASPVTGTTVGLSVLGASAAGESTLTYTWATTGSSPSGVTFSANGTNAAKQTTATFTQAGTYSFQVTIADAHQQTVTSAVQVSVNQTLTAIAASPATANVASGVTQQFSATATDQFGAALASPPTFTWAVDSGGVGSISSAGLFIAPSTGGTATVRAASGSVSGTASVTVSAGLPAPWRDADIGSPGQAGAASASGGTYLVSGGGGDIWDTADQFHYAYQSLSGDGTIVARVASEQNTDGWAKAGVMVRASLDAGAAFADMVVTPGNGTAFQDRAAAGGSAAHTAGPAAVAPEWVKLARSGNTVTGYTSADGVTWDPVGSATLALGTTVDVGLAVTAHNNGALNAAAFDHVSVTAAAASPTAVDLSGAYNRAGVVNDGAKFSGGLDGGGAALSAQQLGASVTWAGAAFALGAAGGNNVVSGTGQTLVLPAGSFSTLAFLAAGVNGNQANQAFVVNYTDGTSQTVLQSISDWYTPQNYTGESVAATTAYRDTASGGKDSRTFLVYGYQFALDRTKTVQSITLPKNANVELLAINLLP